MPPILLFTAQFERTSSDFIISLTILCIQVGQFIFEFIYSSFQSNCIVTPNFINEFFQTFIFFFDLSSFENIENTHTVLL